MGSGDSEKPVFSQREHIKNLLIAPPTRNNDITVAHMARFIHCVLFMLTLIASQTSANAIFGLQVIVTTVAVIGGFCTMRAMTREWKDHKKKIKKWLKKNYSFPPSSTLEETQTRRTYWRRNISFEHILFALVIFIKYQNGMLVLTCGVLAVTTNEMYKMIHYFCTRFRSNNDAVHQVIADHYIKRGEITRVFVPAKKHTRVIYYPVQK